MSWEAFCQCNNVGMRFQNVHISRCDKISREIVALGIGWCERPHSLLIYGLPGRGKTHFTYCLVREAVRRFGISHIRWTKSKMIDDKILQALHQYGDSSHIIQQYCDAAILFMDDFGVDRASERVERDYYELIDARWENMSPTVITTNLTPELLEEKYGSRIFSRFKDYKWIRFDGLDLRGGC
jgi:DNA replication protein DnaC